MPTAIRGEYNWVSSDTVVVEGVHGLLKSGAEAEDVWAYVRLSSRMFNRSARRRERTSVPKKQGPKVITPLEHTEELGKYRHIPCQEMLNVGGIDYDSVSSGGVKGATRTIP